MEPGTKRVEMLVFLKDDEDISYDQLNEIDRLDLRRRSVDLQTYSMEKDAEKAEALRVDRAPSILFVKGGEILKRLTGLTEASTLEDTLEKVQGYRDPFAG